MQIKIQPRQTGKSYDIAQLMLKHPNSICIQPTESQADYFSQRWLIPRKRVIAMSLMLIMKDADRQFKYNINDKTKIYIDELGSCVEMALFHIPGHIEYGTHTN